MKDFMSKEHYCYKVHTLLMKSGAYPPPPSPALPPTFYGQPPLYGLPPPTTPSILHKDLELPFL